jgi:hypothetical protein
LANKDAKLKDAELRGDRATERRLAVELARLFAERGTNLELALKLAERATKLGGEDPQLRLELAGWRAGLGDPAGAAAHLEAAAVAEASNRNLVRAGVLYGRGRRPNEALRAFEAASGRDSRDPIPHELIGTLSSWAGDVVSKDRAAAAYLDAAELRAGVGENDGALEDLLRAFEVNPASTVAAERVAGALSAEGRGSAADEMLRDHAAALEDHGAPESALMVHANRLARGLAADDVPAALSAVLDLGLCQSSHANISPEIDRRIDEVLTRCGLPELLAVRLTQRAKARQGGARAQLFDALARLFSGDLKSDRDAMRAFVESAVADPAQASALDALRAYERRDDDHEGLVEALVRIASVVRPPEASLQTRANLALELAELAESRVGDPALADWALERARSLEPGRAEDVAHSRGRLEAELAERDEEISRVEAAVEGRASAQREARLLHFRKLVSLYGRAPAFEARTFDALAAICRADAEDALALRSLSLLFRRSEFQNAAWCELYESILLGRLETSLSLRDELFVRSELVELAFANGAVAAALRTVLPLLELVEKDSRTDQALSLGVSALVLVVRSGDGPSREQARAYAVIAEVLGEALGALFLAAASETYRMVGALTDARRTAERALEMDAGCTRAATALARVSAVLGGREAAVAIERALGIVVPRAWLCDALSRSLESISEHELSFAWTQRWLALVPSDRRAMAELLRGCLAGTDPARISNALNWVLAQPDPPEDRAQVFVDALTLLYGLDAKMAGQVARRALDVFGPSHALVRERLMSLADEHHDAGLAIAVLERFVASSAASPVDVLVELAQRRQDVSDFDGAASELARAADRAEPSLLLQVVAEIEKASDGALQSDGLIALTEARSRALLRKLRLTPSQAPKSNSEAVENEARERSNLLRDIVESFRMLGALRWDLAEDSRGAEQALFEAAELDVAAGFEIYAHDLAELAGPEPAVRAIFERAGLSEDEPVEKRMALALAAAHLSAEHGLAKFALEAARKALAIEPGHAEAISIAESQASHVPDGDAQIDAIYTALAATAMGVYGRRAAHYRAARTLERLGSNDLAEKHALAAFEAVPNEGTSWQILTRLVDPITGSQLAVDAFLGVAQTAKRHEVAGWYKRALELCGKDSDGLNRSLDVLLRALFAAPEMSFALALQETLSQLKDFGPYPELLAERLDKAAPIILTKLEGPDGARTAAHLSKAMLPVGATKGAFACLEAAVELDGGVEVFERLFGDVWQYAESTEASAAFLERVELRVADPRSVVGAPLLNLAAAFAAELGKSDSEVALSKRAEQLAADDRPPPTEVHEDPFADPAFLADSVPPTTELDAAQPSASPSVEAPKTQDALLVVEEEEDDGEEPVALVAPSSRLTSASPSSLPRTRRSASTVDFHVVKDGFDALFATLEDRPPDSTVGRPSTAPSMLPTSAPPDSLDALQPIVPGAPPLTKNLARSQPAPAPQPSRPAAANSPSVAPAGSSAVPSTAATRRSVAPALARGLKERARELEDEGRFEEAAQLHLELVSDAAQDAAERVHSALAAAEAFALAGDARSSLKALDALPKQLNTAEVAQKRIEVLRLLGDSFGVVVAIDQLIALGDLSEEKTARLLVDAARAAAAAGDEQGALVRARRAVRLAPLMPLAVLECAQLEYAARGMGTPRDAAAQLETLHAIEADLAPEFVELHAFLLAEATDVIHGGGAGLRELSKRHAVVGPLPLIALGMAERLLRARNFDAAVPLFEKALQGDLRNVRNKARVSLAAADAAIQAERLSDAAQFLLRAEESADTRAQVERRRREILAYDPDPNVAIPVLKGLVEESSGLVRARYLQRLGRVVAKEDFEEGVRLLEDAMVLARRDRVVVEELRAELVALIEVKSARGRPASEPQPEPLAAESKRLSSPPLPSSSPAIAPVKPLRDENESAPPSSGWVAPVAPIALAPNSAAPTSTPRVIPALPAVPSLLQPQPAAATSAAATSAAPARAAAPITPEPPAASIITPAAAVAPSEPVASDLVLLEVPAIEWDDASESVALSAAVTSPEPALVEPAPTPSVSPRQSYERRLIPPVSHTWPARPSLLSAAEEHLYAELLAGFPEAGDKLLSGLDAQRRRDRILVLRYLALLAPGERLHLEMLRREVEQDGDESYAQALAHVLSVVDGRSTPAPPLATQAREPELVHALLTRGVTSREVEALRIVWDAGLFRKDAASYGVSPGNRLALGQASGLGDAYRELTQSLGAPRPIHHLPNDPSPGIGVALLAQPAIVVRGPAARTRDLVFQLACAHVSSVPDLILAAHLPSASLQSLFTVLMAAFGPIGSGGEDAPGSSDVFREEARLSAELWQRISPVAERRLRELLAPGPLSVAEARRVAMLISFRAGLFVTADLSHALSLVARSEQFAWPLEGPEPLFGLCLASELARDLVSLAVRGEFAGARWQSQAPRSIRR